MVYKIDIVTDLSNIAKSLFSEGMLTGLKKNSTSNNSTHLVET